MGALRDRFCKNPTIRSTEEAMGRNKRQLRSPVCWRNRRKVDDRRPGGTMTGLFNTSGHETEGQTEVAASHLFEGLASVNNMLSKVELGDVTAAHIERHKAVESLGAVARTFQELASSAN